MRRVVSLLDAIGVRHKEIAALRPKVAMLEQLEREVASLYAQLRGLLKDMDVAAEQHGNYGWEERLAGFLCEMRRQVADEE